MPKSKPHTIRFEESEYNFICKREGLKTAQSILNFLMQSYIKRYKVDTPSFFDVEVSDEPKIFDSAKIIDNFQDEPKKWQEPKKVLLRTFDQWWSIKKECLDGDEWAGYAAQIREAENLTVKQKALLLKPF